MLKVIPAVDLLEGEVVRLHKGDYANKTVYPKSLLHYANSYKNAGFDHIHVVDLNGAREGRFVNLPLIQEVSKATGLSIQTGGGVRSLEDVRFLLENGIAQVICTSMAVKKEAEWFQALQEFGSSRCILGMDLKNGKVAHSGWLETSDEDPHAFLKRHQQAGVKRVLCTDVSKDGTLKGPNVELYKSLMKQFPEIEFIASGGVSNAEDLIQLKQSGVYGCVVGRAYFEGHITLSEMKEVGS
jgi:phosphoribosylformimino-5-aminoimidazole carboxamide ribotide isomerase